MNEVTVKTVRHRGRRSWFAEVTVSANADAVDGHVSVKCSGDGWTAQGFLEEVPEHGYEQWKAGASAGARYAIRVAGRTDTGVTVTRIAGLTTDTNPAIIAAAAAEATWRALGIAPSSNVTHELELLLTKALDSGSHDVPDW